MAANEALSNRQRGLGKGLAVLLGEAPDIPDEDTQLSGKSLSIESLSPGQFQPRTRFDDAEIEALADSIRQQGIIQPLLVRPTPNGATGYEIIAGERRWRAAQRAGLHDVPVVIREIDDDSALEMALVENLQRQDLGPMEEAEAFARLIEEFGHTQEKIAESLGKSRSHVANTLRLRSLPAPVREMLDEGALSAGHARALLGADDPVSMAKQVVHRGLNVRQTESLIRHRQESAKKRPSAPTVIDPNIRALEGELTNKIGLRVKISPRGEGGSVHISYRTLDQLDGLLKRFR